MAPAGLGGPTPVTALLHAVAVVKAGVFAVVRLTWYGFGPDILRGTWAQDLVLAAILFTIVFGSSKALQTKHLKRRLAWSTISNLSYVLLGVMTLSTAGLVAGMTHMVFHAVLKITLFFGVGAVHYKMHRDFVPDIEGCGPLMPVVFSTFTVTALGLMECLHWPALQANGCWQLPVWLWVPRWDIWVAPPLSPRRS